MGRSERTVAAVWRVGLLGGLVCGLGCANPGQPKAPSLHLVEGAKGLAAARVGDEVRISWTTPADSTDGGKVRLPVTAVVCREAGGGACVAVARVGVAAGASGATDRLAGGLAVGAPVLLGYRVELVNRDGRSAGASAAVYAAGGAAPPAVGRLEVRSERAGAVIAWRATSAAARMVVERAGLLRGKREVVKLEAAAAGGRDPGGMIDRELTEARLEGQEFSYTAQRVEEVEVAGRKLEVRGEASAAVSFVYRDTFAPEAPVGLQAIPAPEPPSIALSWEPAMEADVAGYNVYRREGVGAFARVNGELMKASSFVDAKVKVDVGYSYKVTAVDRHHNESAASSEVTETVRR